MIGVWVQDTDRPAVEEFFELFKTPWEFGRPNHLYDIILCGDSITPPQPARLTLEFGPTPRPTDPPSSSPTKNEEPRTKNEALVQTSPGPLPLYTSCRIFAAGSWEVPESLSLDSGGFTAVVKQTTSEGTRVRFGYDLCAEVRHLMGDGQPSSLATIPSLDRHIELLRRVILEAGVPFVEIPPIPEDFDGIVCLSHDVDHVGIRHHKADHTMLGFLYRATVGSLVNLMRGRLTARQVLKNWRAATSLPAVHLGWARDFWYQFDAYLALENGRPSTFFVIPWPGVAGQRAPGTQAAAPSTRAAKYDASSLKPYFDRLRSAHCELALHGLDAWNDAAKGQAEAAVIADVGRGTERGVRMHWLYFDRDSPAHLEAAGFTYDSTSGYNEAIGFRAGTAQVFRPLGVTRLLELPMHVMDTALFYPSRMNLAPAEAWSATTALIDKIRRLGGVLTINWHDRSLAPERLWDDFYRHLLTHLDARQNWFATAGDTVAWFRRRRAARVDDVEWEGDTVRVKATVPSDIHPLPGLRLRVHRPHRAAVDVPLQEQVVVREVGRDLPGS
ncbi:MAG: hypothetical protein ACKV19_10495 [Verrucomicrobiales bacterium]